tara:strand:- start:8804 stop:9451 length:648 start_codon:yes stop_codon:yes gene_type:complete
MRVKSKFEFKDTRTFSEKAKEFATMLLYCVIFWRGRSKGIIHTRNIGLDDFRYIFFPKGFEKYGYLGTQIWNEDGSYFKALYPLVLALDYEAKPKWCPRWFLRFLHVFGMDKSIVRVRNRRLSNLLSTLTKGIGFIDYKTKWYDYDLRISISAPKHLQDLANDIEQGYYSRGRQVELVEQIKAIDPEASITWGSVSRFEKQLEELEKQLEDGRRN